MNYLKLLFNASAVVGFCALSGQSLAWCNLVSVNAAIATEVAIGTLSVPPGATVGTLLKTVSVPDSEYVWITCSDAGDYRFQYGYGTGRSTITGPGIPDGVVSSGVEGIGVKVFNYHPSMPYAILPNAPGLYIYSGAGEGTTVWFGIHNVTIGFYKTGDITPGELVFPKNFVELWASGSATSTADGVLYGTINITGTPDVKVPGCVTPSLTVPLGKHAKSDFSGVGSTSAPTPFTFAINNCDAGLTAVKYTFKPASGITLEDSGLATQHLTVKSGTGAASGIGVQVLYNNGTLVPFNTAISTTAGSHTIPMKARYIQTESTITSGTANSALEFTMTYQ